MAAAKSNTKIEINCDMGESFGLYKMGDDEGLMPHITIANVACGFHASDPSVMAKTVRLAKQHNVKVGAHPSLPDLQGFGRREMKMRPEELTDCLCIKSARSKASLNARACSFTTSSRMARSTGWPHARKRWPRQLPMPPGYSVCRSWA